MDLHLCPSFREPTEPATGFPRMNLLGSSVNTASSRAYAGGTGPGLSAMFEAPEEGYAADTPARVHSGFLIRVPMDTRKTSIWTDRGLAVGQRYGSGRTWCYRAGAVRDSENFP